MPLRHRFSAVLPLQHAPWAGVFGLLIIQAFNNGLTVVGVSSFWKMVAKGVLLIAALIADHYRKTSLKT